MSYSLYPLKFTPVLKDKVWGSTRLKTLFGKNIEPLPNCGESWELSSLPGSVSVVRNGFLAGNELPELIEVYMEDLVGQQVYGKYGWDFPLLFKFIDTASDLSVQVHPNDTVAVQRHQGRGKTELWYVIHAEPGAEIISGFAQDVDRETYLHHLQQNTLHEILRADKVEAGDVFFIPPGQVHAIGAGITLCEIQQSSDITYRIYDWDRTDEGGHPRKLHTDEALDVIDFHAANNKIRYQAVRNAPVQLIQSAYFTTRLLTFDQQIEQDYVFVDSFVVYNCVSGSVTLQYPDGSEKITAGETVMIPAELKTLELVPDGEATLLETYIH